MTVKLLKKTGLIFEPISSAHIGLKKIATAKACDYFLFISFDKEFY